jgi:energy-converting hydrogenase Eha subunit H
MTDKSRKTFGKYSGSGKLPSSDNINSTSFEQFKALLTRSNTAGSYSTNPISTSFALVYTTSTAYFGGVLDINGDIHYMPFNAAVGQKISNAGVVSTYSLVYTTTNAYNGGVIALNGDIHFVPGGAVVGQKIDINGVVSTYSLVYTSGGSTVQVGGVLNSNGDIHMIPFSTYQGQKIDSDGVVSTYSLVYTVANAYRGGVLAPNGVIHMIPYSANKGQTIIGLSGIPFSKAICSSPFLNIL